MLHIGVVSKENFTRKPPFEIPENWHQVQTDSKWKIKIIIFYFQRNFTRKTLEYQPSLLLKIIQILWFLSFVNNLLDILKNKIWIFSLCKVNPLHHAFWFFFSLWKKVKNINLWKWFSRTCYAFVYVSFIDEFSSWHLHHGGNHRTVKGVGAGQFFEWKSNNYFMEIIHNTQILSYVAEKRIVQL